MTPFEKAISESGLKKGFLAKKAEIAPSTMSRIVAGAEPTLTNALRLARVLNKTVEELWGYLVEEEEK